MSKVAHTPGPWTIHSELSHPWHVQCEPDCLPFKADICQVSYRPNAYLIAASPDLLSVAKECVELAKLAESLCGCRGDDDYVWGIQDRLEAAIAKAEGRQP